MGKIINFVRWFFSPSVKIFPEDYTVWEYYNQMYERLEALEEKYNSLQIIVSKLEEENIETSNCLYEIFNDLDKDKHNRYNLKDFTLGE